MRKTLLLLIALACFSVVRAQFPHSDTAYYFLFGNSGVEEFRDVCNHSIDSGYVAVGSTSSFSSGSSDIYLVKTDWKCNTLWSRSIGSAQMENGYAVKETYDKGFIIGGFTNNTVDGDYDMYLVKTDSQGFVSWEKKIGGADWDLMYSLTLAPDSGFILCGETYSFGNASADVYVVRTDKDGNVIWQRNYGGAQADGGKSVILSQTGSVLIAGYTASFGAGLRDGYLLNLDYTNGDTIWTKAYGGALNDEFNDLIIHSIDGAVVAVGYTENYGAQQRDYLMAKFDMSSTYIWSHVYTFSGNDIGYTVTEISGGQLWATNNSDQNVNSNDIWSFLTSPSGWPYWGQNSASFGQLQDDLIYSHLTTLRKHYLFAGKTESGGDLNGSGLLLLVDSLREISYIQKWLSSSDTLVSIPEILSAAEVNVFPNPTTEYLIVETHNAIEEQFQISIIDVQGRVLLTEKLIEGKSINVARLSAGIYFLNLVSANKICTVRFVKRD